MFAATAITPASPMAGIYNDLYVKTTETLLINGHNKSLKLIKNHYYQ